MKKYLSFFLLISISFVFTSCSGDKTVDEFYELYNINDYESIGDICVSSISEQMKQIALDNYSVFGENISHKQYAFSNVTKKGKEIKILSYKSEYENEDEVIYEKFYIDIKNEKISSYIYSADKDFIDNYETYSKKGSELTFMYYDNLIDDNFAVFDKILDKELIVDKGLKDKYVEVLKDRRQAYGKIVSYAQININTYFSNGLVKIIQRFECITDKDEHVFEELRLVERNGEFKIYDYYYAPDYATLIEE